MDKFKKVIVTTLTSEKEEKENLGENFKGEYLLYFPKKFAKLLYADASVWINTEPFYFEINRDDARASAIDYILGRLEDAHDEVDIVVISVSKEEFSFWHNYFINNMPDAHEYDISFFQHTTFLVKDLYLFRPDSVAGTDRGTFIQMFKEINAVFEQFFHPKLRADDFDQHTSMEALN